MGAPEFIAAVETILSKVRSESGDPEAQAKLLISLSDALLSEERCVDIVQQTDVVLELFARLAAEADVKLVRACLGCLRKLVLASGNKPVFATAERIGAVASLLSRPEGTVQYDALCVLRCLAGGADASCVEMVAQSEAFHPAMLLAQTDQVLRSSSGQTMWLNLEAARLVAYLCASSRQDPAQVPAIAKLADQKSVTLKHEAAIALSALANGLLRDEAGWGSLTLPQQQLGARTLRILLESTDQTVLESACATSVRLCAPYNAEVMIAEGVLEAAAQVAHPSPDVQQAAQDAVRILRQTPE